MSITKLFKEVFFPFSASFNYGPPKCPDFFSTKKKEIKLDTSRVLSQKAIMLCLMV